MKTKIIIIDDDIKFASFFSDQLKDRGYDSEVKFFQDSFFEQLDSDSDYILLLDIIMPNISGIEVLKKVREKYSPHELPVIMLTVKDAEDDIIRAFENGANDYLTKPANLNIAEVRIKTQLSLMQLNQESLKRQEIETINSMIITYNHEINNPLAIALSTFSKRENLSKDETSCKNALERIRDIVKKIQEMTKKDLTTKGYSSSNRIYEVK